MKKLSYLIFYLAFVPMFLLNYSLLEEYYENFFSPIIVLGILVNLIHECFAKKDKSLIIITLFFVLFFVVITLTAIYGEDFLNYYILRFIFKATSLGYMVILYVAILKYFRK